MKLLTDGCDVVKRMCSEGKEDACIKANKKYLYLGIHIVGVVVLNSGIIVL